MTFCGTVQSGILAGKELHKRVKDMRAFSNYCAGLLLVAGATVIGEIVRLHLSPPNMVMLYLLAVLLAALKLGLRPAIFTAASGVLAFDFFFVPPRFSLTVADKEYLVTFLALFIVSVVISSLVAKARERSEELIEREAETAALYRLSKDIASAPDNEALYKAVVSNAAECFSAESAMLVPFRDNLQVVGKTSWMELSERHLEIADWSFKSLRKAGYGTETFTDSSVTTLPLVLMGECVAILLLSLHGKSLPQEHRLSRMLEGFALQLKMAMHRVELAHQAEQAQVFKARENLERALLNSVSHDLRTPLSIVTGVLSTIREEWGHLSDEVRHELLDSACSESARLNRFVGNLLDMTRIEAGAIRLNVDFCDVQDLVGCALASVEQRLGSRPVQVDLASDLPLIPIDMVFMTQVLVNLLDNSNKYAPFGSAVVISASVHENRLLLEVADEGPGVPEHELNKVFEKFYRTSVPEVAGGTGLGLSICKGIVEAHDGKISAANCPAGGFKVSITLPLEKPGEITHDS